MLSPKPLCPAIGKILPSGGPYKSLGLVVDFPWKSITHPSGMFLFKFLYKIILPSATIDVEISRLNNPPAKQVVLRGL